MCTSLAGHFPGLPPTPKPSNRPMCDIVAEADAAEQAMLAAETGRPRTKRDPLARKPSGMREVGRSTRRHPRPDPGYQFPNGWRVVEVLERDRHNLLRLALECPTCGARRIKYDFDARRRPCPHRNPGSVTETTGSS